MKSAAILTLLICLAEASYKQEYNIIQRKYSTYGMRENNIKPRIVNGQVAHDRQFPYMADLKTVEMSGELDTCAGSLISQVWVITAGHCLFGMRSITVYLGSIQYRTGLVHYNVTRPNMVLHPEYNDLTLDNDLGLLHIPTVTYSLDIKPISLPKRDFTLHIDSITTAMGWGLTSTNGSHPSTLMYTKLKVISNAHCALYYGELEDTKLCALPHVNGAVCHGDSGGPLVFESQQFSNVLVGIVSGLSHKGCFSGEPDGFTRVTSYINWIRNRTGIIN